MALVPHATSGCAARIFGTGPRGDCAKRPGIRANRRRRRPSTTSESRVRLPRGDARILASTCYEHAARAHACGAVCAAPELRFAPDTWLSQHAIPTAPTTVPSGAGPGSHRETRVHSREFGKVDAASGSGRPVGSGRRGRGPPSAVDPAARGVRDCSLTAYRASTVLFRTTPAALGSLYHAGCSAAGRKSRPRCAVNARSIEG